MSIIMSYLYMVTDDNYAECGEHFAIHIIVESLYRTPETNVILCINYT